MRKLVLLIVRIDVMAASWKRKGRESGFEAGNVTFLS